MNTWIEKVEKLRPCLEAVEWGKQFETIEEAWEACERGDWMLWLLGRLSGKPKTDSRKKLVLCACECGRLALPHVPKDETRPLQTFETAEAWARGDNGVTLDMVRAAAYTVVYVTYEGDGTNDVAYAAFSAAQAAYAAYFTHAAFSAAQAAYAGGVSTLWQSADIVRKYYLEAPEL